MSGVGQIGGAAGGGSPTGAAGGELAGTYPNPTVKDAVIDDANIVAGGLTNAAISASAAIAASKLAAIPESGITNLVTDLAAKAPLASPSFTGTVTLPEGNDAVAGTASRRTLGLTGTKAMPGTATLDQIAAPVADRTFGGFKATLLGTPVAATDAAPFGQTPDYQRKQAGLVAENFPKAYACNGVVNVSQSLYQLKVWLPYTVSVTGVVVAVQTAGATLTSAQCLASLYDSAGTLKGSTADQSTVWNAAGTYAMAFGGGPFSMTGGDGVYCWVTILSNGTTPPTFSSGAHRLAYNALSTGTATGVALLAGRNGAAVTAAPSPLVPANAVITGATSIWVGLY